MPNGEPCDEENCGDPADALKEDWKSWPLAADLIAKGALANKGFLIAAPTGTGKSTLATMLMIEYLKTQEPGFVSFYLVPLKALAEEAFCRFKSEIAAAELDRRVAIATGDYDDPIDFSSTSLVVATYEKLNALMGNHVSFSPYVVVADEFQIVGTGRRGPPIEGMMTLNFSGAKVLLFVLSAVVSNPEVMAKWLGIDYFVGDKRHRKVKLNIEGKRTSTPSELTKRIVEEEFKKDPDSQILVFRSRVEWSESQAKSLTRTVEQFLNEDDRSKLARLSDCLLSIGQFNAELAEDCKKGVGFHNADLTKETRRVIERAFRDGYLKVIACTPTLAQGINTPAKVVIIPDVTRYSEYTSSSEETPLADLLNMVGRAGRPGHKHEEGTAYVYTGSTKLIEDLKAGVGEPTESRLGDSFTNVSKFVLQFIRGTGGATKESLLRDVGHTLWASQNGLGGQTSVQPVSILDYLRGEFGPDYEPGRVRSAQMVYDHGGPTVKARVKSSSSNKLHEVEIYEGGFKCTHEWYKRGNKCSHIKAAIAECLFGDLIREPNVRNFVYLAAFEFQKKPAIPVQIAFALDLLKGWQFVEEKESQLSVTKAGEAAAISYLPIDRLHALWEDTNRFGPVPYPKNIIATVYADIKGVTKDNVDVGEIDSVLDWMNEVPPMKIATRFEKNKFQQFIQLSEEMLYALETCDQYAGILGKAELQSAIRQVKRRIRFGVQQELLPLAVLNISGLNRERCRSLYDAEIRNLEQLKGANSETLSRVFGERGETVRRVAEEMWSKLQDCLSNPSHTKDFLSTYRINPDNASLLGLKWPLE